MNNRPDVHIERIANPSPADLSRVIAAHRPVIFTRLMNQQAATTKWDLPYLRTQLGQRPVMVVEQDRPRLRWDPASGLPMAPQTFDGFADSTFIRRDPGFRYMQDDVNSFAHLRADYQLPPMMEEKGIVRGKLWMSGEGLITPLHYDAVETFHWVIRGSKRFLSYQPGVRQFYPFSWRTTAPFISQVDPDHHDPLQHPRFAHARPVDFVVNEGEVLYLPAFWWHQVYSLAALNLSLNFVWWASLGKYARHIPQVSRAARHIVVQYRKARAKARAAAQVQPSVSHLAQT